MCLAIPSQITSIDAETAMATVDTMGVSRTANLGLIDEKVSIGDWVLVHVGVAMTQIDEKEARETLALYEQMIKADLEHEALQDGESVLNDRD
ncbi:MAG: HypC/HybG/HupF family hydrogenase formation chaperone [Desulfuromonadaceae bacterium]|nr:HypC/HybG/HupF family hydrogenase formation chaperone [Desulfuromonadaceae bacterium]